MGGRGRRHGGRRQRDRVVRVLDFEFVGQVRIPL